jgi:drug/metabolite transporter (DMT)-like permease
MISASVVQMLSSSCLIFTALLTVFFLKKKLYRHHIFSIVVIILGISLVSLNFILHGKGLASEEHSPTDMIIGLVCLQLGEFLGALGQIIEEKFFGV